MFHISVWFSMGNKRMQNIVRSNFADQEENSKTSLWHKKKLFLIHHLLYIFISTTVSHVQNKNICFYIQREYSYSFYSS